MSFDNFEFERINTIYGPFYGEFKISKLSDICVEKTGVQTGPFGSQLHNKDYVIKGTPIVTVEHLGDNCLIHENLPRVTEKDKERLNKYILKEGDIVFSRVGSVDRRAYVKKTEDGWLFSGRCLRVRPNDIYVDSKFLSYFFGLSVFKQHIRNIAVGATMPSINTKILSEIDIVYPQLKEQKAIAHILSTLDEKIEVNNQINKTLEKMAQAIFKQWFVDFEFPNEAGEPYQSSGGEMVESELGLVPKGWGVGSFTDYIDVLSGGTPKTKNKEYWDGEIPFFTPKDTNGTYCICTEKSLTEVGLNSCNSKLYDENTIFITARGTVGKIAMAGVKMAMNQSCYALVGKGEMNQFYVWFQIKSGVEKLQRKASGSVFDAIIIDTFKSIKIIKPDTASVEQFRLIVEPVFQSIQSKYFENEKLVSIRDSLLSKLMTGEIRVSLR